MGLVAEDGPEAIIPLGSKRRSRGVELWERAGELLGVKPYAEGGIVGLIDEGTDVGSAVASFRTESQHKATPTGIAVPVTIQNVTFEVKLEGNTGEIEADTLVELIKKNVASLTDEIARQIALSLRQVFANMPMAVEV